MKILVLGGTKFLGRHLVEQLVLRDHQVTLFNRGLGNPDLFPEVKTIIGDRDGNLEGLLNQTWDTVIDTSGYIPRLVKDSAEMLNGSVGSYVFISTISVYRDFATIGIDESYPVGEQSDPDNEEITGETYGPLKAQCEEVVKKYFPNNHLIVRPGLIVGPNDATDRFTYWPVRFSKGGTIVLPSCPERPVQFIDVRDLASWIIKMVENRENGTYNATGPGTKMKFGEFINHCQSLAASDTQLQYVDEQFLLDNNVSPWIGLPLWLPTEEMAGMLAVDIEQALKKGLTFRDMKETLDDTLEWAKEAVKGPLKAGLSEEKERELVESWLNT